MEKRGGSAQEGQGQPAMEMLRQADGETDRRCNRGKRERHTEERKRENSLR